MNLVFFIGSLYGGGAERVTCNLANYMVDKGHSVTILAMAETKESYCLDPRVSKYFLAGINETGNVIYKNILRLIRFLKFLLIKDTVDAYVVMLPITTILLLLFSFCTSAKIILAERADPNRYSSRVKKFLKLLAHRADGYVFQTEDAKKWYSDCINVSKSCVIPNAINKDFILPLYEGKREKVIVGVGRLNEQKNFGLLISAFSKIKDVYPDYKLVIYGEGPLRVILEQQIKSLELENSVLLPGNVQNIEKLIRKASLFVLSSNYEGMPNALMEAMAIGLPCIATDCPVGGPRYLIKNGENGLLFDVGDERKLITEMVKVLSNKNFAQCLSINAQKISEYLSPSLVYRQWESFLRDL